MPKKEAPQPIQKVRDQETTLFGVHIPRLPASEIPLTRPDLATYPKPENYPLGSVIRIMNTIAATLGKQAGVDLAVTEPPPETHADFSIACHRLAKFFGKAPGEIAQDIEKILNTQNRFNFVRTIGATPTGYLNFELDMPALGTAVIRDIEQKKSSYGRVNIGNGKTVVIDCSSPNVAKYMSVAHLRSTVNGESLARLYRAGGYAVIRDNHLGDWGTQFGMLGRARELWGKEIDRDMSGADPVQKLYRLYVRMYEEIEKEKAVPGGESVLEREGRAWFRRLESGDPASLALLRETTAQSRQELQRVYTLLGSQFEYTLGESFYVPMLAELLAECIKRGIARTDGQGMVSIEFPKEKKLDSLIIKKSDGASLYSTRDLATLVARVAWFHPHKILYVVGGEQKDYFKKVFAAFDTFSAGKSPELEHIPFGKVTLPGGDMSTRKGRVVFLEDVLRESISRAKIKVREKNKDLSAAQIDTIARQVGVGAVIYMDLGQSRERKIEFDWDTMLSLDGNSGPYIQYAHVRARKILQKASQMNISVDITRDILCTLPIEADLIKHLGKFPEVIAKAIAHNEPSIIAIYTQKTADLFNRFYTDAANILGEKNVLVRNSRLRLTAAASQVIKNGLYLLGIEAPEQM